MANLATLMVGLGYDLSALEKGAPEAFRLIDSQTLGMSAEMKRASREGAESFRLIDEALGIHLSRPLTRILTQEFPAFAKGLQSLLGAGAAGVIGVAAFEFIEKGIHKAEEAAQKQEQLAAAAKHVEEVIAEGNEHYAAAMETVEAKLAAVAGNPAPLHALEQMRQLGANVDDTRKRVDQLSEAMEKAGKAAEEAGSLSTRIWGAIAEAPRNLAEFYSIGVPGLGKLLEAKEDAKQLQLVFRDMKEDIDQAFRLDALRGTHETLTLITADLERAQHQADLLHASGDGAGAALADRAVTFLSQSKEWVEALDKLNAEQRKLQVAEDAATALDKERAAIQAADAATNHFAESLVKQHTAALASIAPKDQFAQFADAVRDAEIHYTRLYQLIGEQAFFARFHESLQQVIADMRQFAGEKLTAPEVKIPQTPIAQLGGVLAPTATPAAPTLGAGGTTAAQFDVFSSDTAAQLKAAAAAYADIVTPQEKYQLAQQELNLLLEKGLIDWAAYTAALQKASEQMVQAEDHIHKMQEELQKLLERSDSAAAGVQAFFLQLQIEAAQNGREVFNLLNQGLKGFEDELAKAVFTGKANWKEMFRSMAEDAFKFLLQKDIANLFKLIGGTSIGQNIGFGPGGIFNPGGAQQGPAPALPPTAPGSATGLGALVGGGSTSGAQLQQAASTLQLGSTTLQTAATQLQSAASTLGAGGGGGFGFGGGGGGGEGAGDDIPGFASGTDSAPGGLSWVGEQGPELLNVPAGSSITPNSALRSGGDQHFYIDAKGAEIGVEEKIVRALQAAKPGIIGAALANFSEVQRRTPQRR